MIGIQDVKVSAHNPDFPLEPVYVFVNSAQSFRVKNVPRKIGQWEITKVFVNVSYPDNTTISKECVANGCVWVGTVDGCSTSGTCVDGFVVTASGIDEDGNSVSNYVLGAGDLYVKKMDGSISPETTAARMYFYETTPSSPSKGDTVFINGTLNIWDGTEWNPVAQESETPSYIEDSEGNKIEADRDYTQIDHATSWVVDWDGEERFLVGEKTNAAEPIPSNPQEGDLYFTIERRTDWWVIRNYYHNGVWIEVGSIITDPADATELDLGDGNTATWQKAIETTGKLATEVQVNQKQDQLSQDQLSAINAEVDEIKTVVTYTQASGLPQWEGMIVGEIAGQESSPYYTTQIPNVQYAETIRLGTGVTSIGYSAFEECASLTSVTIPESVTSIGGWAFRRCASLTSITIPASVTSIGQAAFRGCGLTSITIPNSVTSIGNYAFEDCESLTSISIPDSVTSIGHTAFFKCFNLTSVTIGSGVTSIGIYAFNTCDSLTSLTFKEKTLAQVQEMDNYPWALTIAQQALITVENNATQEWVGQQGYITSAYPVKNDGGVANAKAMTQNAYDALPTKDSTTLYVITEN